MALGHVRALDEDAVRVLQVLLEAGGAAAAERCPQTGDGGAVSNTGLVLDLHRAHGGVELLHEVVLLVVEGCPSEARYPHGPADLHAVLVVLPGLGARPDHPVGDHLHRRVEVEILPLGPVRPAILDLRLAATAGDQLLGGTALGAEPPAADRRVGIAFDLDDLLILHEDPLAAADRAGGADALDDAISGFRPRRQFGRRRAERRCSPAQPVTVEQLTHYRPAQDRFSDRSAGAPVRISPPGHGRPPLRIRRRMRCAPKSATLNSYGPHHIPPPGDPARRS